MNRFLKNASVLCAALAASCAFAVTFAACGEGDNGPDDGGKPYAVQAPAQSDIYTVTGLPQEAKQGDSVSFKVTLNDPENSSLNEVTVEPTFDASFELDPAADGTCTFTMPDGPVKIIIDAEKYEEVLSEGVATFSPDNATTIVKGSSNGSYRNEDDELVDCWILDISFNWGAHNTGFSRNSYVVSSNEDVIPAEAITFAPADKASDGNWYYGADVRIDTQKINPGSTWLKMYFQSYNSGSKDGTLCVKITVVDSVELETMRESVVIDFNGYADEGEDILVRFFDNDHIENSTVNGKPAQSYVQVAGKVGADGKATFSFDYIAGHKYSINIYKGTEWYSGQVTNGSENAERILVLGGEVVDEGSSVTGYDQYVDGELSFVNPDSSLELTVEGTFQEVNWPGSGRGGI